MDSKEFTEIVNPPLAPPMEGKGFCSLFSNYLKIEYKMVKK